MSSVERSDRDERADEQVLEPRALDPCLGGVHLAPAARRAPRRGRRRRRPRRGASRPSRGRAASRPRRSRRASPRAWCSGRAARVGAPRRGTRGRRRAPRQGPGRPRRPRAAPTRRRRTPPDQRRKKLGEREEERVRGEDREEREHPRAVVAQERRHGEGERHDRGEQRRLGADVHAGQILDGFRAGVPASESAARPPRRVRAGRRSEAAAGRALDATPP